jgi:assimilatory nitrate reductase catalytic subunit
MFQEWSSPEATLQILKRCSRGRPCDITGIEDYRHLDASGGIQWPCPEISPAPADLGGAHGLRGSASIPGSVAIGIEKGNHAEGHKAERSFSNERRLFEDGQFFTEDGRAKFLFDAPRPVAEPVNEEYPFVLLTGRGTSAQWHTNTRTGKSATLRSLYPKDAYVEIHPVDAARLGLTSSSLVQIVSRRGRIQCAAWVRATVQPGHIFLPMHYELTNQITRADFDPHSRQPSYKYCAVRLEPATTSLGSAKDVKAAFP